MVQDHEGYPSRGIAVSDIIAHIVANVRFKFVCNTDINPSGGTLPSKEGQLPNWSLRLSVEARRYSSR